MKNFVILLSVLSLLSTPVLADEFGSSGDLWDNFNNDTSTAAEQQKAVTDEQFNSVLEKLKSKRKKKPKQMKGESIQQSNETEELVEVAEELPVVCISIPLKLNEDAILPVGHYQAKGELVNGKPRIKLYQAQFVMADFPAVETNDDFNEPELNFIKMIDHSENQVKIIFGSMDFNAYAIIDIAEE